MKRFLDKIPFCDLCDKYTFLEETAPFLLLTNIIKHTRSNYLKILLLLKQQ